MVTDLINLGDPVYKKYKGIQLNCDQEIGVKQQTQYLQEIDLQILFSDPINFYDNNINFEKEIEIIYEDIKQQNLQVQMNIDQGSMKNFQNSIRANPKILHFIGHGEIDDTNQFYLLFEDDECKLQKFYEDDIKKILERIKNDIILVFINACYSQKLGEIFSQSGIPFVVCIEQQHQIANLAAQNFAGDFYQNLFKISQQKQDLGEIIKDSFDAAQDLLKANKFITCCCYHTHEPDCKWYNTLFQKNSLKYKAHLEHSINCSCKDKNITGQHRFDVNYCSQAHEFMKEYNQCYNEYDIDFMGESIEICCCGYKYDEDKKELVKTKNHEESIKYKLLINEERSKQITRKFQFEIGEIEDQPQIQQKMKEISRLPPRKYLYGRRKQIQDLYNKINENKVCFIWGQKKIGKRELALQVVRKLMLRKKIEVFYEFKNIDDSRINQNPQISQDDLSNYVSQQIINRIIMFLNSKGVYEPENQNTKTLIILNFQDDYTIKQEILDKIYTDILKLQIFEKKNESYCLKFVFLINQNIEDVERIFYEKNNWYKIAKSEELKMISDQEKEDFINYDKNNSDKIWLKKEFQNKKQEILKQVKDMSDLKELSAALGNRSDFQKWQNKKKKEKYE